MVVERSYVDDGGQVGKCSQCWRAAVMITSPLFGLCWLPNNSVLTGINSVQSNNKLFGRFVWNQQCFLTIGQGQTVTPYVGFWNSVAIFHPSSHPFNMETR